MQKTENSLQARKKINEEKVVIDEINNTIFLNEEISATQICNSFEQDARRYKRFLGDDGKMMER